MCSKTEGEMDEAPMLYSGERLGTINGSTFDIAEYLKEYPITAITKQMRFQF